MNDLAFLSIFINNAPFDVVFNLYNSGDILLKSNIVRVCKNVIVSPYRLYQFYSFCMQNAESAFANIETVKCIANDYENPECYNSNMIKIHYNVKNTYLTSILSKYEAKQDEGMDDFWHRFERLSILHIEAIDFYGSYKMVCHSVFVRPSLVAEDKIQESNEMPFPPSLTELKMVKSVDGIHDAKRLYQYSEYNTRFLWKFANEMPSMTSLTTDQHDLIIYNTSLAKNLVNLNIVLRLFANEPSLPNMSIMGRNLPTLSRLTIQIMPQYSDHEYNNFFSNAQMFSMDDGINDDANVNDEEQANNNHFPMLKKLVINHGFVTWFSPFITRKFIKSLPRSLMELKFCELSPYPSQIITNSGKENLYRCSNNEKNRAIVGNDYSNGQESRLFSFVCTALAKYDHDSVECIQYLPNSLTVLDGYRTIIANHQEMCDLLPPKSLTSLGTDYWMYWDKHFLPPSLTELSLNFYDIHDYSLLPSKFVNLSRLNVIFCRRMISGQALLVYKKQKTFNESVLTDAIISRLKCLENIFTSLAQIERIKIVYKFTDCEFVGKMNQIVDICTCLHLWQKKILCSNISYTVLKNNTFVDLQHYLKLYRYRNDTNGESKLSSKITHISEFKSAEDAPLRLFDFVQIYSGKKCDFISGAVISICTRMSHFRYNEQSNISHNAYARECNINEREQNAYILFSHYIKVLQKSVSSTSPFSLPIDFDDVVAHNGNVSMLKQIKDFEQSSTNGDSLDYSSAQNWNGKKKRRSPSSHVFHERLQPETTVTFVTTLDFHPSMTYDKSHQDDDPYSKIDKRFRKRRHL